MTTGIDMPTSLIMPELMAILTLLITGSSIVMPGIDRGSKRFFFSFYSILLLNAIVFMIDILTYKNPTMYTLSVFLPFIEYLLFALPTPLLTIYLLYCCNEDLKNSIILRIVALLLGLYFIMLVIAQFTKIFYYTTSDGQFYRTKFLPFLYIPLLLIMILTLVVLIKKQKKLSKRYFYGFLICILPLMVSTTVHALFINFIVLHVSLIIGSITMYVLIITDQIDKFMRQQSDIAKQNASIMVLQMRPHFIYNTMTSIYYLCEQDPKKAQNVILDFTTYLRKNFNAIASNDTVPFSQELEHVRAYLSVELAQFEDNLFVEYDTKHTQFRLPPLTLQPLVENAIKHGMDPDSEPLHILIQTYENNSRNYIIVKDNGPGFNPANAFDSNNALSNIKQRLTLMCHGTITINSTIGEGTVITLEIP